MDVGQAVTTCLWKLGCVLCVGALSDKVEEECEWEVRRRNAMTGLFTVVELRATVNI